MKTISLIQGTPEWMAHRAQHFNASDAPAMMGCSPHMTRSELLHMKKTGIAPEVDAATQRRFDDGHRFEALARPLAEKIVGEDLYAVTGTNGELSASFDGLTLLEDTAFEHKSLNESLRYTPWDEGNGYHLPLHYQVQMEHQLMVSGAERVLFMATKWGSDGELKEERHCWYASDPALRAKIVAGWEQFEEDLASYVPADIKERPIADVTLALPALVIHAKGEITTSNMLEYGVALSTRLAEVRSIALVTDQDFSNAKKSAQLLRENIQQAQHAKDAMLAQTATVGEAARMIDTWCEDMRVTALQLEKDVEREDKAKKAAMVLKARSEYEDHIEALKADTGGPWIVLPSPDWASALKNKRNFASMQDALDTMLANAKITANDSARKIRAALDCMDEEGKDFEFLLADRLSHISKPIEDIRTLVRARITEHRAKVQRDAEAAAEKAREQIRKEEADRLEREAEAKRKADEAEANRKAQEAIKTASTPAPVPAQVMADHGLPTHPMFTDDQNVEITSAPAASVTARLPGCPLVFTPSKDFGVVAVDAKHQTDETPTMKLGDINARLALVAVTADDLAELGFTATLERGAKLYRPSDFPKICAAIVRHVQVVALGVEA